MFAELIFVCISLRTSAILQLKLQRYFRGDHRELLDLKEWHYFTPSGLQWI